MKILVTGSEGKIAKEVIKKLQDHELLLVDKKSGCNLAFDNLDHIKQFRPEIIIHLAASFERTDETPEFHKINYEDNILATYRLNQIIASLDYCPKQYIFASSYLVYEPNLYLSDKPLRTARMLSEVDELNPRNLIGASKLYAEKEIDYIQRNIHKDMLVTHARIFRVFGDGGQEFISRCIEWKKIGVPVDLWKPENRFDYISAENCASALVCLFGLGGVYNVGTGQATSILDVMKAIDPKVRHITKDDLYESSCADISLIKEKVGWVPTTNVIEWIKERLSI